MNTQKLFSGTLIPTTINTNERIFQLSTYDGETILCNVVTAQNLINNQECKGIKHYWNHKFVAVGKIEVLTIQ